MVHPGGGEVASGAERRPNRQVHKACDPEKIDERFFRCETFADVHDQPPGFLVLEEVAKSERGAGRLGGIERVDDGPEGRQARRVVGREIEGAEGGINGRALRGGVGRGDEFGGGQRFEDKHLGEREDVRGRRVVFFEGLLAVAAHEEQRERDLRELGDDLVDPRGDAALHIGISALEQEADVGDFCVGAHGVGAGARFQKRTSPSMRGFTIWLRW